MKSISQHPTVPPGHGQLENSGMKYNRMKKLIFIILLISGWTAGAETFSTDSSKLTVYPAPAGAKQATDFQVFVNNQEIFVYDNPVAAYACFDFKGTVEVMIRPVTDVKWVDVRPLRLNIRPEWKQGVIRFKLRNPCNISVELNRHISRPLFIFSNPPEENIPDENDKNVLFFKAGRIYDTGLITLKSDQTVYIEGGAIVRGAFLAENARHVEIRGRGILDGSHTREIKTDYTKWTRLINFINSADVTVRDIILHNSNSWQIVPMKSEGVIISNVKLVSGNPSDDGIDIVRSSNVIVDNCFIRVKDDCIAIKAFLEDPQNRGVENVLVKRCVLWNAEWGNGMEIGFELESRTIRNIIFRDIDVIHVESDAVFSIHNSGNAIVENVLYENIRVEQAAEKLFDLAIFRSQYSRDKPKTKAENERLYLHGAWDGVIRVPEKDSVYHAGFRGQIRNITFKNIRILDGPFPYSIFNGFDKNHRVENITVEGLWICEKRIKSLDRAQFYRQFSSNIIIK